MVELTGYVQETIRMDPKLFMRIAEYSKSVKYKNKNALFIAIIKAGIEALEKTEIDASIEASHKACNPEPENEVPPISNTEQEKKTEQIKQYSGPSSLGDINF